MAENFPTDYRACRKAFIAACEGAGADVVSRIHPKRGPDGKPLFLDAAAFGPRLAQGGVLAVAGNAAGAAVLLRLLAKAIHSRLPDGTRLVLVHGADPATFAWNDAARADPAWVSAMLQAVVTEDLSRAKRLTAILLGAADFQEPDGMAVTCMRLAPDAGAEKVVEAAIRGSDSGKTG